jgi:ABC-type nitrate/sulfonate/bicarbonate transport system substrate-binding protein
LTGRSLEKNSLDMQNDPAANDAKNANTCWRRWRHSRPALLFLLILTGCAAKPDPGRTFKLGVTSGAQEFVDFVMEGHGLLDQVGLKADKVKSLSPANLHLMVAERKVDIGFAGFTTMAMARSEGKDLIVIFGVFSPVNMVFVPKDSPIKTLSDLKGKKLGVFGGPGSTTFAFLAVIARNWSNATSMPRFSAPSNRSKRLPRIGIACSSI